MIRHDEYWRRAKLKSIMDGDTVRFLIDLGYRVYGEQSIRLAGITAPRIYRVDPEERRQGIITRDFVAKWFEHHGRGSCGGYESWLYYIHSMTSDGFGRYLGEIVCLEDHSLNDDILKNGHAKPYRKEI